MGLTQQRTTDHDADTNSQRDERREKRIRFAQRSSHVSYLSSKQVGPPVAYGQRLFTVYPAAAPLSTAVPPLLIGTLTLTVAVAVLPNESVTLNVIVYTRPLRLPSRSRRNCTDLQSGAITMSLRVLPSPPLRLSSGSSLLTFWITTSLISTLGSQLELA